MIYTITLNPSLDYIMETDGIEIGQTNRSRSESIVFGGKGINVSYILKELGKESIALGFVAGVTGKELLRLSAKAGINGKFTELESGNTRINVKLRGREVTEINAKGIEVTDADVDKLLAELSSVNGDDTVVLSGSVPKNAPPDILNRIASVSKKTGASLVVDMSGQALSDMLGFNPKLVKPNIFELSQAVGMKIDTEEKLLTAAKKMQSMGAHDVLVSMGENGAFLLCDDGSSYRVDTCKTNAVNTVGAGDSMLAGYIVGLENGRENALRLAMAAGAATAASMSLATKDEISAFMKKG